MITDSIILTFLGMGVVFIFLLVMIACMNALKALLPFLDRIMPQETAPAPKTCKPAAPAGAAVAAAVAIAYSNSGRN